MSLQRGLRQAKTKNIESLAFVSFALQAFAYLNIFRDLGIRGVPQVDSLC